MRTQLHTLAAVLLLAAAGATHAASLAAGGYAENFDGMGTTTALPASWSVWTVSGSHSTWTSSITANGATHSVAAMTAGSGTTSVLLDTGIGSSTKNASKAFNIALSTSPADRVLSTSPTGNDGTALQLALTNDTGASFSSLLVSYDIVRFTTVSAGNVEELPGYWLFYSLDGSNWSNVAELNPTQASVPNTSKGVSTVSDALISLSAPVAAGSTFYLRWVDDNGEPTSPDQIIGLNNVNIAAVPEPETYALMLAGLGLVGAIARRRGQRA